MKYNEEIIKKLISWTDEERQVYSEFFSGVFTGEYPNQLEKIVKFARDIEGHIYAKMKAVKKEFPEAIIKN